MARVTLALVGAAILVFLSQRDAHAVTTDLSQNCVAPLNAGTIPADFIFGALQAASTKWHVGSKPTTSGCASYTWTSFTTNPTGPQIWIQPTPVVNVKTSDWDCNHTMVKWGLFEKDNSNPWVFLAGGEIFGKRVRGACTYIPGNPPGGAANSVPFGLLGRGGAGIQFRVATQHWQHDDPALGHTGQFCGGMAECTHDMDLLTGQSLTYSGAFVNTDWDTVYPPTATGDDWDQNVTKGTCAPGWIQSGMSNFTSGGTAHKVLCRNTLALPGEYVTTLSVPGDHRSVSRTVGVSSEWAPGKFKLECGTNQYVAGSSLTTGSSNTFKSIMCARYSGTLSMTGCYTRVFDTGDADSGTDNEDWDPGYYKGECGAADYMAGVSVTPATSRPYSLLCCPR